MAIQESDKWEEAMEQGLVDYLNGLAEMPIKCKFMLPEKTKRKPHCSHPRQVYRGAWFCKDCGKRMPE